MNSTTRRTMLKGGIALGGMAMLGALGDLAAMPVDPARRAPAIFIFDGRFAASVALADRWARRGVPVLDPRDHDLGLAWRGHIPALLADGRGIEGATWWTDRWLCDPLAGPHGLRPQPGDLALPGPAGEALRQWVLA